jgi:hypothetical protein
MRQTGLAMQQLVRRTISYIRYAASYSGLRNNSSVERHR